MKIDLFASYLKAREAFPQKTRERQLAITISREVGAGGRTIAELVGQQLTAAEKAPDATPRAVFDLNLAKQVLQDHKLPSDLERFMTEDAELPVEEIVEEVLSLHPSRWTLVRHTTQTILRLAGLGHVIVVGRGGNVITARLPNVFHVRLVAPLLTRIRHTAEYYQLKEAEAASFVREKDQARRRYVKRYFNAKIDDPTLYDVTLNTGRLGFESFVGNWLKEPPEHPVRGRGAMTRAYNSCWRKESYPATVGSSGSVKGYRVPDFCQKALLVTWSRWKAGPVRMDATRANV